MSYFNKSTQNKSKTLWVFIGLFLLAFAIRFPFFFRDYIDKDESTFILMGQAWAEGSLPYLKLWDLKPPITFAYFAGIISVFGKSLWWIRFGGVLLVSTTAILVYLLTKSLGKNHPLATLSALCTLFFSSLFGSVQGVMSEHIAMPFYMAGLLLWCYANKALAYKKWGQYALGGFLLGLSAMSKLNLAYPILLCAGYLSLWSIKEQSLAKTLKTSLSTGIGVLWGIFITAIPYWFEGALQEWWKAVFLAPRAYAVFDWTTALILLPIVVLLLYLLFKNLQKKIQTNTQHNSYRLVLLSGIGVFVSFILAGKINGHYLLQAYPLIFTLLVWPLPHWRKPTKKTLGIVALCCIFLPLESYKEYIAIDKNKRAFGTYYNGEGIAVPAYLKKKQLPLDHPLFLEYHIGYWILGKNPPSMAVTHPSNLFRTRLYPFYNPRKTAEEELRHILDSLKPTVIVTNQKNSLFQKHQVLKAHFAAQLSQHYRKDTLIGKAQLYLRILNP